MRRTLLLFASLYLLCSSVHAQTPKREFRGAWIATVNNIDWPSKPGLAAIEQQQQFIHRLDQLKSVGCNAVIVQVRPVADAFYASKIEPWSHYLTGRQGEPPFPYYDPLIFMIEETHKRNMEFHAWFNPFRTSMDNKKNLNPPKHVTRLHPDWVINYGRISILDPGIPEAREYVLNVITDVVKRYDIDAVHLDDYFYPYPIAGAPFNDTKTYNKYGEGMSKEDWRRNNVNLFIAQLNSNIKSIKPYVKLGISPFGIWRNKTKDPEGSETRGLSNYDDLYADVLLWIQKGWIDYMMPQLYWEHNHRSAPFNVLMPWWYGHCFRRHLFYGLGLYNMAEKHTPTWSTASELLWQIRDIRGMCPNSGFCFYNASSFDKIKPQLIDSLSAMHSRYPALIPAMTWLDSIAPAAPVLKTAPIDAGTLLTWQENNPTKEPLRYVVYRFQHNEAVDLERNDRIISIQQENKYIDRDRSCRQCSYVVTALDRLWNESKPSNKAGQ